MKKVLFGGFFDLIHLGHIEALKQAKQYGDYLVVNVCSDKRTKVKKGEGRPIIPGEERVEILKAIRYVDEVLYRPEVDYYDPIELVNIVKPDVLVVEKASQDLVEECLRRKITLIRLPRFIPKSGLDTSKIIKKINETFRFCEGSEFHTSTRE